jgi:hypothetical protein
VAGQFYVQESGALKIVNMFMDAIARIKYKLHYHSGRVMDREGNQYWYFSNFKQNRENDLPAYVGKDGSQEWWSYGKRHRANGEPALVGAAGTREWWVDGERHRDHGPAIIRMDGTKEYYQHGKLTRDDGPAIERPDGKNEWFRDGVRWAEGPSRAPEIREQKIEQVVQEATVVDESVKVMAPLKFKKPGAAPSP